jgi:hypothetical protein
MVADLMGHFQQGLKVLWDSCGFVSPASFLPNIHKTTGSNSICINSHMNILRYFTGLNYKYLYLHYVPAGIS